ncbi:MAG TPA: diaminopimelate epimerase [bacterium]|nr:diaminopimelate epimerase [bacterium]
MKFTKLHGAGNDYLYIDAMNDLPDLISNDDTDFYKELAIKISDRHFGVGSDGIIIILPPSAKARKDRDIKADFRMRTFNIDGSEGEMCGNGIRCFAKYVYDYNLINKKTINIETLAGIKTVELFLSDDVVRDVKVFMGFPAFETNKIPAHFKKPEIILEKLTAGGMDFDISCVSMGNPHCVIFVNDVKSFDVGFYGPLIENDKLFPKRVNVEFVQVQDPQNVLVRTWERGSGETLACGTGACAVYSVMKKIGKIKQNGLGVNLYGGTLKISGELADGIYMTGPAEEVFTGYYDFTYK